MLNNLTVTGNLTQDPEAKKDGTIATFTLAVSTGKDDTLFLSCVAFEKSAEVILKKLIKGDRIVVSGKLVQNNYTNKDGVKKSSISCVVNTIEFIKLNKVEHEEPVVKSKEEPVVESEDEPTYEELVNELMNNNPKKEVG